MASNNTEFRISLGGMIKAQNLARKIKSRALFLVNEKRKSENHGQVTLEHKDEPNTEERVSKQISQAGNAILGKSASYRLEPRRRFFEPDVRGIIKNALEANLDGKVYDSEYCKTKAKYLSDLIKDRVKALNYERYKIISLVYLGQSKDQGLKISSLCLLDEEKDNFAEFRCCLGNIFAVGVVYGIYME